MADNTNALIIQLLSQGVTPEQLKATAESLSAEPTKKYFLDDLLDPNLSPQDYAVSLNVSNWASIVAFFRKESTDAHHPQRVYQSIRQDIAEAIRTRNSQKLILALMMGAKAAS
jgi:hypothetical protein